jgi:hypothetical protein
MNILRSIIYALSAIRETSALKRAAKRAGIDPDTDAEFRAVNGLN